MKEKRRGVSLLDRLPADLVATVAVVLITDIAVFVPVIRDTALRTIIGIPFLLFVPGYALIGALFPETGDSRTDERVSFKLSEENKFFFPEMDRKYGRFSVLQQGPPITVAERILLSFGTSIIIVPLIGFGLNFTMYGIQPVPVVAIISGFTLLMTAIATLRRDALPPEDRFGISPAVWLSRLRDEVAMSELRRQVNLLLGIGLLISVAGLGYALATPADDPFTEFYLVTETDSGEYVASGYPRDFTVGESKPVIVAIASHREEPTTYTVVALLQRVNVSGGEVTVIEERIASRFSVMVPANETRYRLVTVSPTMVGENLRLTYLLYVGDPPANPTMANARLSLYLRIDVAATENSSTNQRIGGRIEG